MCLLDKKARLGYSPFVSETTKPDDEFRPVSARIRSVSSPPIEPMMRKIRNKRQRGETVYSMAQAVPWYGPPPQAVAALGKRLNETAAHLYSPDPGLLSARSALARDFADRRRLQLDPETELQLTCGASQAFLNALLTICDPGERILLVAPYYFDHLFTLQYCGAAPQFLPMTETAAWALPWTELEKSIPGARALVLVNPGNPTGAVCTDAELKRICQITAEHGCYLILDESYERFNFTGQTWHPWQEKKYSHVVTLGSFSKSFGISGWRLGYLFAAAELLREALKVQDSAVICAPTPAQHLLELCLQDVDFVAEKANAVQRRLQLCRQALQNAHGLDWREAGGGFFTLAACPGLAAARAADILLDEYGIGTIPGSAFGACGEQHVRISFGCLSDEQLGPAMDALASVHF